MNPKLKDRLLKLLALAESSNVHESTLAMNRINALCVKHGVNVEDLLSENEKIEMHWFRYDDKQGASVLLQTIARATNIRDTWTNKSKQRQIGVKCTESQAAEISLWWSIIRAAFNQHLKDCTSAFIMANKLYAESSAHREDDYEDVDWNEYERQARIADTINPTQVLKVITKEKDNE